LSFAGLIFFWLNAAVKRRQLEAGEGTKRAQRLGIGKKGVKI